MTYALNLYNNVTTECSKLITKRYSTSFSLGTRLLDKNVRPHIYNIYGFVRFADEIVDTFHEYDKQLLFDEFKKDTYAAIDRGISLNPVLQSFQLTVNEFNIEKEHIDTFLFSMEMDLSEQEYDEALYEKYILGSAEVVGLMCLRIFCGKNDAQYKQLKAPAMDLGSAFQKINFLRDFKADYEGMGRVYFPEVDMSSFGEVEKKAIEADIDKDFKAGLAGIKALPKGVRLGVYIAYMYYYKLFKKVKAVKAENLLKERIRISDVRKIGMIFSCYFKHKLDLL